MVQTEQQAPRRAEKQRIKEAFPKTLILDLSLEGVRINQTMRNPGLWKKCRDKYGTRTIVQRNEGGSECHENVWSHCGQKDNLGLSPKRLYILC